MRFSSTNLLVEPLVELTTRLEALALHFRGTSTNSTTSTTLNQAGDGAHNDVEAVEVTTEAPTMGAKFELKCEPINVWAISQVLKLVSTRLLCVGSGDLFLQLFWLKKRALNVRNRVGHV